MRQRLRALTLILCLAAIMAICAWGSGTSTITEIDWASVQKVTLDWRADSAGTVDTVTTKRYTGIIWRVSVQPDTGRLPLDNYDLVVYDEDTVDVLDGDGANLDSLTTYNLTPVSTKTIETAIMGSTLRFVVANAGSAGCGKVHVYVR